MKNNLTTENMDEQPIEQHTIDTPKNAEQNEKDHVGIESSSTKNCPLSTDAEPVSVSTQNKENLETVIKCEPEEVVMKCEAEEVVIKCEPDSSSRPKSHEPDDDQESIRQSILDLIEDVFHASICRNLACNRNNCRKLKRIFLHTKSCSGRLSNPPCTPCRHLLILLSYHAHICEESAPSLKCTILRCKIFKDHISKARERQQQRSKEQNPDNVNSSGAVDMSTSNASISTSLSLSEPASSICNDDTIIINPEADTKLLPDEDTRPT